MIKAIETNYHGYRFRSRLEARWAVFFDAAGVRYIYESEGYVFNGKRYLPDFYLPDLDCYFEVKGDKKQFFNSGEDNLIAEFVCEIKKKVYMVYGEMPNPKVPYSKEKKYGYIETFLFSGNFSSSSYKEYGVDRYLNSFFAYCQRCGKVKVMHFVALVFEECDCGGKRAPVTDALKTARAARFEHGETPRIPLRPGNDGLDQVYLSPCGIGEMLGGITGREINLLLERLGYQEREGKSWYATEKGRPFSKSRKPRTRNRIRWQVSHLSSIQKSMGTHAQITPKSPGNLASQWNNFLFRLGKEFPQVSSLLREKAMPQIEGGRILITMPHQFYFATNLLSNHKKLITKLISEAFGAKFGFKFILAGKEKNHEIR